MHIQYATHNINDTLTSIRIGLLVRCSAYKLLMTVTRPVITIVAFNYSFNMQDTGIVTIYIYIYIFIYRERYINIILILVIYMTVPL